MSARRLLGAAVAAIALVREVALAAGCVVTGVGLVFGAPAWVFAGPDARSTRRAARAHPTGRGPRGRLWVTDQVGARLLTTRGCLSHNRAGPHIGVWRLAHSLPDAAVVRGGDADGGRPSNAPERD